MGVRIAVIIALSTLFSYLHIFNSFRKEALLQMEQSVHERSQREQAIFLLAQDNHAVLKKALEERIRFWNTQDPAPRFDSLFVRLPDGSTRNIPQGFDGTKVPGVIVPRDVTLTDSVRRRILAAYEVVSQYGPAFEVRFTNTGVLLPEGVLVGYWPEGATWFQDVEASFSFLPMEYLTLSLPENNPQRVPVWTGIFEDTTSKTWMVTLATPLDVDGQHAATLTHDVLLDELMHRTIDDHLPGAYNFLVRDDGQLIAHPTVKMESGMGPYTIPAVLGMPEGVAAKEGTPAQRAHLSGIFERVKSRQPGQRVLELPEFGEYIAMERLRGPGWTFVTVLPEHIVASAAIEASRYVLLFGLVSLLLELGIMSWVLRLQITRPLLTFTQASRKLEQGDFDVTLDIWREDELGQLARAFHQMAGEIQRREEALRQANEGLEQRVEERTRELKEAHRKLVETALQVGRAEIATNVLHNVGNVLSSVLISVMLAKERLTGLKLDNVERVAALLEEHQADLSAFIRGDRRGQTALPFLIQLGKNLQSERKEIQLLLNDVTRHTEHIGAIVNLQQRYARTSHHLNEQVDLRALVDDALRINQAALGRHRVKVERILSDIPSVLTEKHKVLLILVNLISNAKYALDAVPEEERRLIVRIEQQLPGGQVHIEVKDNGVGIAPELLTRIFQHGFTTRQEGHGFGLHSSALAAQELGGSLRVHSNGPGQGASFILELPAGAEPQGGQPHA
ncbi:ATP-binding protein [Stigmatella erecta]|uniref:histidine kinase n=1 Tax=Stigmatella erecta TaxID=83460 RepID=A0A1I0FS68_9BACT|nr:ATP-binding protein [Stigmatella erecta]SET60389.1 Histidine kinase-, DNA gyrase B-, and HSP90-like ATPase [Stigmatella erecta]